MHQDTESDMFVETPFSGTYTTFHHRRLKVEDKRATVCIGIRWSVLSRFVSVSVCVLAVCVLAVLRPSAALAVIRGVIRRPSGLTTSATLKRL